jgi:endoglucanase
MGDVIKLKLIAAVLTRAILVLQVVLILALAYGVALAYGAPAQAGAALQLRVSGNHLVDRAGNTLQLRGVNVSGLEFVAMHGWSAANPWGGSTGDPTPHWAALKTWKVNSVRIPLNEGSWLGTKCKNGKAEERDPDPGHNYRATVKQAVDDATAAGFYVIVDLHWTAPNGFCALAQNPMADEDNSPPFWTQVADQFKSYPNVAFELFNEPFFNWLLPNETDWGVLRNGGTFTHYVSGDGPQYSTAYTWNSAGMQSLLNAVRATGASNVVLVGAPSWCQDLSRWVEYKPNDPLKQIAAVWHAYPNSDKLGDPKSAQPKFGPVAYSWVQRVLDAGYAVVITEFGDHNAPGTKDAPFVSNLLPWADKAGASYLGWTWDAWQNKDNILIKDGAGTPSDGFGTYVKQHYLCVAEGKHPCD